MEFKTLVTLGLIAFGSLCRGELDSDYYDVYYDHYLENKSKYYSDEGTKEYFQCIQQGIQGTLGITLGPNLVLHSWWYFVISDDPHQLCKNIMSYYHAAKMETMKQVASTCNNGFHPSVINGSVNDVVIAISCGYTWTEAYNILHERLKSYPANCHLNHNLRDWTQVYSCETFFPTESRSSNLELRALGTL